MAKVLITSGGTKVPIDAVRDITNMSKGTFGSKIAESFLDNDHNVIYFCASDSKSPFSIQYNFYNSTINYTKLVAKKHEWCDKHHRQYTEIRYRNYDDYAAKLYNIINDNQPDIIVLAAAVSDYVTVPVDGKVRSSNDMDIILHKAPKVISHIRESAPNAYLVGFKLLVGATDEELISHARDSIHDNKCDAVVANDLNDLRAGRHRVLFVTNDNVVEYVDDQANRIRAIIEEKSK